MNGGVGYGFICIMGCCVIWDVVFADLFGGAEGVSYYEGVIGILILLMSGSNSGGDGALASYVDSAVPQMCLQR